MNRAGVGRVSEAHAHPHPPSAPRRLRLADVLTASKGHTSDRSFAPYTRTALRKLARCRSGYFGYNVLQCKGCGHEERRPRGCGLRHCPSCGRTRAEDWVRDRKLEMLDCPYYQLVFTLPPLFYPLVKENPELLYGLLLDTVRDVLLELAKDPRHLGGIPQFLLALHTWNGALDFHVHVHALMAAGAFDAANNTWIPSKHKKFLFSVKVLSKLFRGKFIAGLQRLADQGRLSLARPGNKALQEPGAWKDFRAKAYTTSFFTFVDKPAAGPDNVLEYLGHYLYRTGISNHRLVSLADGQVTFLCKDRKKRRSTTGSYTRTVPVNTFVDLYAQHILPKGFHRIRFGGLWAQGHKKRHLAAAREAVTRWAATRPAPKKPAPRPARAPTSDTCPACKRHPLVLIVSVIPTKTSSILVYAPVRGPPGQPIVAPAPSR